MDAELLDFVVNWRMGLIILLVFGFAPGALLRLVVLAFRRDDPRRSELLAELHRVPRWERPLWVVEQIEVALFEGILERVKALGKRRRERQELPLIHRSEQVQHDVPPGWYPDPSGRYELRWFEGDWTSWASDRETVIDDTE